MIEIAQNYNRPDVYSCVMDAKPADSFDTLPTKPRHVCCVYNSAMAGHAQQNTLVLLWLNVVRDMRTMLISSVVGSGSTAL